MPDRVLVVAFWAVLVGAGVALEVRRQRMTPAARAISRRRGHRASAWMFGTFALALVVATATAIVKHAGWLTAVVAFDALLAIGGAVYFWKRSKPNS